MKFTDRLRHGWNAFMNRDPTETYPYKVTGPGYANRPDRPRFSRGNEKSIVTSIYNRIALDVSSITIRHCQMDENGRFKEEVNSKLNRCLNFEANIDQTGRAFIQDIVMSMLDEGVVAVIPIDTTINPNLTDSYDIASMRTGKILEWYPEYIRVRAYNDQTGRKEDIMVPKKTTAIIENPLFAVVNESNSTVQRLIRKLNLLDAIDEQSGSGKMDLIVQVPYSTRSDLRKKQAEGRRKEIEDQLTGSKYGIAYADASENIIQLNRPVENNLMNQIEYLTKLMNSQLGITESIMDGTADEQTQLNYMSKTIEPIISAIVDEMNRKFLTKTAISQNKRITYFRDPFKLVPVNNIAEIADKFTRNEIMTSNEIRQVIGMAPSSDPNADVLRNKNLSEASSASGEEMQEDPEYYEDDPEYYEDDPEYYEEETE